MLKSFFYCSGETLNGAQVKASPISTENQNEYQGYVEHNRTQALLHEAFRDPDDGSTEVRDLTVLLVSMAEASHLNLL